MKILQSSIFRALTAIAIGCLLIKYPDNTMTGITIAIGVLFLLSGLVSLLSYWNARRHAGEYQVYDAEGRLIVGDTPTFPIVGVGSMLLGCILTFTPTAFVSALMYVIGIVLVLGAVNQYMSLIAARRFADIGLWYWICPTITLLLGFYIMVRPLAPLEMTMTVLGWLSLFYGVTEIINTSKIYACKRQLKRLQQETDPVAEEVEEVTPQ